MAGQATPGQPAVPPLDPGLLRVIRESAAQLRGREEFTQQLQYDLAMLIPDLAGLRTEDGWVFCERMVRALLWTATTDQPAALIAESLRRLGALNWREGFPEAHYVSVAHALVRTVRELSGFEWSTSYASAWISFYQWMRPHLVAGAQWAAAQQAAGRPTAARPAGPPPPPAAPSAAPPRTPPPNGQYGAMPPAGPLPEGQPAPGPPYPAGRYPVEPPPPGAYPAAGSAAPPSGAYPAAGAAAPPPGPYPAAGAAAAPPSGAYPAAGAAAPPPGLAAAAPGPLPATTRDLRVARSRRSAGEAELESAAEMLDDEEEDEGPAITEIMLGMTRNRRQRHQPPA
jgi:hypothetical protein